MGVPPPVYKTASHTELIPGGAKPFSDADLNEPLQRGFYLATIAHCMECHSRRPDGAQDYKTWQGKGGYIFKGPFGQVPARNISSHREKGIGALDRCRAQDGADQGHRSQRPLVPPADGAAHLLQQDDGRRSRRAGGLGADHPADRVTRT
jgi:hypothetical protein